MFDMPGWKKVLCKLRKRQLGEQNEERKFYWSRQERKQRMEARWEIWKVQWRMMVCGGCQKNMKAWGCVAQHCGRCCRDPRAECGRHASGSDGRVRKNTSLASKPPFITLCATRKHPQPL